MKIIITDAALQDVSELRAYLKPICPSGFRNVVQRLKRATATLSAHPRIGRPTTSIDVRELVEPRYGYVIPYTIIGDTIFVLRYYRSIREPLDYDELELP